MMKRLSLMFATLAWLVAGQVSPTWAGVLTGNSLTEFCLSGETSGRQACTLYVQGVADTVAVGSQGGVAPFKFICIPDEVTGSQLHRVVVKFLEAHPESTHGYAIALVLIALRGAFPCQS